MIVKMYTDGACRGNPGPGGWGVVLCYGSKKKVLSGAINDTTNNRMELMAAISGLQSLNRTCQIDLFTDSKYVKDGITLWIKKWKECNWRTSKKQAVKNQDLWMQLEKELERHDVKWHWIKGHNGHSENEEADLLAREAINTLFN